MANAQCKLTDPGPDFAENAAGWLRSPIPSPGDRIPVEMARTDIGAREVGAIRVRMAHGVY